MQLSDAQKARMEADKAQPPKASRSTKARAKVGSISPMSAGVGAMIAGLEQAEESASDALAARLAESPDRIMALAMEKLEARGWNPENNFRQWTTEFAQIPTAITGRNTFQLAPAIEVPANA